VNPDDPLTLLCVPHAGGSARVFHGLGLALPGTRMVPLELPGHGRRMGEPLGSDFGAALDDLVRHSAEHTRGPYVLLGHSLGAMLAFELARHWTSSGRPPTALVLVGRNSPTWPRLLPLIHRLDTPAFMAAIRELGGTPPQLFDSPELVELFAPLLRADLTISETYRLLPGGMLDCPLWICAGAGDTMVDKLGMRDWSRYTTGRVVVEELPGGHFVLDEPEFHRLVARALVAVSVPSEPVAATPAEET
jgi:medium-chain acyl-[acyl-carrier-protein] hydrolase